MSIEKPKEYTVIIAKEGMKRSGPPGSSLICECGSELEGAPEKFIVNRTGYQTPLGYGWMKVQARCRAGHDVHFYE